MNKKSDGSGLSSVELVVLARFSAGKKPSETNLCTELHSLGLAPASSSQLVRQTVSELANRGLLNPPAPPKAKAPKKSRKGAPLPVTPPPLPVVFNVSNFALSDEGKRALRSTFGVANTPSWTEVRDSYLPALALGLPPGSAAANEAGSNLPMNLLRMKLKMPKDASLTDICNALLLRRLGLNMSEVTLASLRAQVLANALNVKDITTPKQVVAKGMSNWVGSQGTDKKSMVSALSRRWLTDQSHHWLNDESVAVPPTSPPKVLPEPSLVTSITLDALVDVVHDALPRIGTEGRYGSEKVFVSAIWRDLEEERRLPSMSLDSFKRNLIQAMRSGRVRLARADLVGAMDAKLVAESEIHDQGATFHFVLDQRNGSNGGRRSHV